MMSDISAGLPWFLVLGLIGFSAWLHSRFGALEKWQASAELRIEALQKSGTNGTVTAAIVELSEDLHKMNDKLESDFQMVTLCLIQLSNGNKITPADLKRKS